MSAAGGAPLGSETTGDLKADSYAEERERTKETTPPSSQPQSAPSIDDSNEEEKGNNQQTDLIKETELLRDTLDLLWSQTLEQRNMCQQLEQENEYLQEYISNLMTSSNVLEK